VAITATLQQGSLFKLLLRLSGDNGNIAAGSVVQAAVAHE
jgi:hypothetical protein